MNAVAVKKQGHDDLYRSAFLQVSGHCKAEGSEAEGAIQAIVDRGGSGNLHSGDKWNFCLTSA